MASDSTRIPEHPGGIMRHTIFSIITLFSVLYAHQALAVYRPGMERPSYSADLTIEEAQGSFQRIEKFTITKFTVDGSPVTGFYVNLGKTGEQAMKLQIIRTQDAGCGSKIFHAMESPAPDLFMRDQLHLTVIDHSTRLCDDLPANYIEATLELYNPTAAFPIGTLSGSGTIEPIYTIQ